MWTHYTIFGAALKIVVRPAEPEPDFGLSAEGCNLFLGVKIPPKNGC
jgi:hypothetical protein